MDNKYKLNVTYQPVQKVMAETGRIVIGHELVRLMSLATLAANGHCLAVGEPGSAKTLFMECLARTIKNVNFKKISMTADLRPSDIVGYVVETPTGPRIHWGPIKGAHILLADEFNRANPQTQGAFLEVMQQRKITLEGQTEHMPKPFFMVGTINPVESLGVFPIAEAAGDRWMSKVYWPALSKAETKAMLRRSELLEDNPEEGIKDVLTPQEIFDMQKRVKELVIGAEDPVIDYVVDLTHASNPRSKDFAKLRTRKGESWGPFVKFFGGNRAAQGLQKMAAALALFEGEEKVLPRHVKLAYPDVARAHLFLSDHAKYDVDASEDEFFRAVFANVQEP